MVLRISTVELHLSGLNGMASYQHKQNIEIIDCLFEYRIHWQFEFLLLLFTVCTYV
jgi:hypothetical protein